MGRISMLSATPKMATLLLVNPDSRLGAKLYPHYLGLLKSAVNLVDAGFTHSQHDMAGRIREGLEGGVRRFIIGGGDGTLSAAADVLADTDAVLGILPLGTGNTFSRGLGLPATAPKLVHLLAQGPLARYDLGVARKDSRQTMFLNSLTMGFSERLVELLTRESKNRLGHLAWIMEFRQALAATPTLTIKIGWPGGSDEYETRQLVVVNGRTIAAGITATPQSSGQDGLLEIFRLGAPSLSSIFKLGAKLLAGRLLSDSEAHYRMLPEVTIDSNPALPASIDGDIWLSPPLQCRVLPAALWVISPIHSTPSPDRWPLVAQTLGAPRVSPRQTGLPL